MDQVPRQPRLGASSVLALGAPRRPGGRGARSRAGILAVSGGDSGGARGLGRGRGVVGSSPAGTGQEQLVERRAVAERRIQPALFFPGIPPRCHTWHRPAGRWRGAVGRGFGSRDEWGSSRTRPRRRPGVRAMGRAVPLLQAPGEVGLDTGSGGVCDLPGWRGAARDATLRRPSSPSLALGLSSPVLFHCPLLVWFLNPELGFTF